MTMTAMRPYGLPWLAVFDVAMSLTLLMPAEEVAEVVAFLQRLVSGLRTCPVGHSLAVVPDEAMLRQRFVSGLRSCPALQALCVAAVAVAILRQRLVAGFRSWPSLQGVGADAVPEVAAAVVELVVASLVGVEQRPVSALRTCVGSSQGLSGVTTLAAPGVGV